MKLSYSTLACPDWDIKRIVKYASENDYDGVELRGKAPHISKEYNQVERQELRKLFLEHNLEIPCVTAYSRFNNDDPEIRRENVEELKAIIELASDVGAPYVRTFGADADNPFDLEKVINWIAEAFDQVDEFAGEKDVKVLLETHDVLSKGKEVKKIFERSQTENCGILWDVAHSIRAGEDIVTTMDYLNKYIYHIHFKDWLSFSEEREDHYVLLAAGLLPLADLLQLLKERKYQGYLSLEWEKTWNPEIEEADIAIKQYAMKMRQYMKKLHI